MKTAFLILADGVDITVLLADRLVSLTLSDEAGMKSDTAQITIDDRDHILALPTTGAQLDISLGFEETGLVYMGQFIVDEVTGSSMPNLIVVKAKAADMAGEIRAPKIRAWSEVTLGEILQKISGEHGLEAVISEALESISFAYLAQTSESDLNFLSRIAKDLDATVKPASGRLVLLKRGDGKAADGTSLTPTPISASDLSGYAWKITSRGAYKSAVATWAELGTAVTHSETAGEGTPCHKLRHKYPNKAEAKRAAQSALDGSQRASGTLSGELAGFQGALFAEGQIEVAGLRLELAGIWTIKRVAHRLGATLTTRFEAERDAEEIAE